MRSIYLDYNSTTPLAASVRDAMLPYLSEFFGHPHGAHWFCRAAEEAIEDARSHVAALLDCHPNEIILTGGGTESVNLGLLGVARAIGRSDASIQPHLIVSKLEHACVLGCAKQLQREGWEVTYVGCDEHGIVRIEELEKAIVPNTRMLSIVHTCPNFGTIQPSEEIAQLCHEHDILYHSDAAQAIGKTDCNVRKLGVDLLSLSGHKFYAPKGVGALFLRTGVPIEPILFGEGCEAGIRPGTPNVPSIVGLGQAAKLALAGLESTIDQTCQMRDRMHAQLESAIGYPIPVHGASANRVAHVLSCELPGVSVAELQQRLPELCLAPPSTCLRSNTFGNDTVVMSGKGVEGKKASKANGFCKQVNLAHVAMGLSAEQSASTLRISIGWNTSEEEMQRAVQMIATAYDALK